MSTPKLTNEQKLRDMLVKTVNCVGELFIARLYPNLMRQILAVLKDTEEA